MLSMESFGYTVKGGTGYILYYVITESPNKKCIFGYYVQDGLDKIDFNVNWIDGDPTAGLSPQWVV